VEFAREIMAELAVLSEEDCAYRTMRFAVVGCKSDRSYPHCSFHITENDLVDVAVFGDVGHPNRPTRVSISPHDRHPRARLSQILDLLAEDNRLNVYAGEREVRPPGAPTTELNDRRSALVKRSAAG
jgi:hypothetical protein